MFPPAVFMHFYRRIFFLFLQLEFTSCKKKDCFIKLRFGIPFWCYFSDLTVWLRFNYHSIDFKNIEQSTLKLTWSQLYRAAGWEYIKKRQWGFHFKWNHSSENRGFIASHFPGCKESQNQRVPGKISFAKITLIFYQNFKSVNYFTILSTWSFDMKSPCHLLEFTFNFKQKLERDAKRLRKLSLLGKTSLVEIQLNPGNAQKKD